MVDIMFKKISEAETINKNGYRVKLHYRYLTYIEDDHALSINIENESNPFRVILSDVTIDSWYPPHNHEIITSQKKKEIIKNITDALFFLKINHKWE